MPRPEVLDEYAAVLTGGIMKVKGSRKSCVNKNQAVKSGRSRREYDLLSNPIAPGEQNLFSLDSPAKALAGGFADFCGSIKSKLGTFCGAENCLRQRMFGVALESGGGRQDALLFKPRCALDLSQGGTTVGQGPRLVKNKRPTRINLFENCRILDDDSRTCGEGNRPDDSDRNRDQQGTGCGNHQHCQEAV